MALVLDAAEPNKGGYIRNVLEKMENCSICRKLDIVIVNAPDNLAKTELLVRECYGYCLATGVTVRVFPSLVIRDWPFVFSNVELDGVFCTPVQAIDAPQLTPTSPHHTDAQRDAQPQSQRIVALGGTFDHFHIGHKLLLTVGGLWARHELIVGVTGPELLKDKKFAEELDTFEVRAHAVKEFVGALFPSLKVSVHQINDVYGPTGTEQAIDALVVSQETAAGGSSINEYRRSKQWPELVVFEVGLVPAAEGDLGAKKMSSTWYRELQAKRRADNPS